MHENILTVWDSASTEDREAGGLWYRRAHDFCVEIAENSPYSVRQIAGATAALSPMLSWERNLAYVKVLVETGDAPCLKKNVRKGNAILLEGLDPSSVLGGRKVQSFFHNIADPDTSRAVTIDRHAFDIAVGCTTDDATRKSLNRKGYYQAFARLYRAAADEIGVLPHVVQATTWLAWKRTKEYASNHATLYQTPERLAAAAMV